VQVNFQSLVGHNAMLLAAGLDDRKHVQSLSPASDRARLLAVRP
jgi:hypothetical protein